MFFVVFFKKREEALLGSDIDENKTGAPGALGGNQ